jgi:hypothetical protein
MADLALQMGGDLAVGAGGDLLMTSGAPLTQQRIFRRLLTNAGEYLWNLAYGAGLSAMVGEVENGNAITGIIRSQIFAEASVAQAPEPTVKTSTGNDGTVVVDITYTDATTGNTSVLSLPIG